jgi:hypothetical protein
MKRTLIYAAAVTLMLAVSVPSTYAHPTTESLNFPHVISLNEFPQGIRHWRILRHTLRLEIPQQCKALSQLTIEAPSHITVRDNIDISDQSGKKINANVSINDKKVILAFALPVAPGTILTINMNKVKKSTVTTGDKLYRIFAKLEGNNAELPIGVAQLRNY